MIQSLVQARIEERYNSISESTVGIIFLGTPHQGSKKVAYATVLSNIAIALRNKTQPRLVKALQINSEELMQLAADFRLQVSKYHVYSFYETEPMKGRSTVVSQ